MIYLLCFLAGAGAAAGVVLFLMWRGILILDPWL